MKKIAIIGGGISGCFLSFFLKKDYEITLFEKSNQLGGLCKTLNTIENIPYQQGLHVLKNPDQWIIDIIQRFLKLEKVEIKEGINPFVDFNTYDYPLYIENIKSISWHWMETISQELKETREEMTDEFLSDFLIKNYGYSIYNIFFSNLYKKIYTNAEDILFMNEYKSEFSSLNVKQENEFYFPINQGWNSLFLSLTKDVKVNYNSLAFLEEVSNFDLIICTVRPDFFLKKENILIFKNVIFDIDSTIYKKDYYDKVIYPNHLPFVSMSQLGKLFPKYEKNIIVKEYINEIEGECAYIPLTRSNIFNYNTIVENKKNIIFAGRQGSFKNLSMTDCIKQAADLSANIKKRLI